MTRPLGASGIFVSEVGVGCNNFGRSVSAKGVSAIVSAALSNGVNFFDTADVYGDPHGLAEELLGRALVGRRSQAVVATKFGFPLSPGPASSLPVGHGRQKFVVNAVEGSLRRLRSDYLDLLQVHVPDPATPIEETLAALDDLCVSGKVRSYGLSRYSVLQLREAAMISDRIASIQTEYSLLCFDVEDGLLPCAAHLGVAMLACLPLASGLLSGKYRLGMRAPKGSRLDQPLFGDWLEGVPWPAIEAIREFGARRSLSMISVSLGYLLSRGAASALTGVTTAEQLLENVASSSWRPNDAEAAELRAIVRQFQSFPSRVPWERAGRW